MPPLLARPACCLFSGALLTLMSFVIQARAETPLHQRIDRSISAGKPQFEPRAAAPASDAEFLRRIYLDLTGTIPAVAETRAFLGDATRDKRQRLIERL